MANCIDTKNHEGVQTIFTEEQRLEKAKKHSELRHTEFIEMVRLTIEKPDFIYMDLGGSDRHVCYCREYKINSRTQYTKVIIRTAKHCNYVVTAYRPDYVKERNKTELLYGTYTD